MADGGGLFCETNGMKLRYTRTGMGKPPLVLLHGLGANGACWTEVAQALQSDYDVVMPDLRGHGMSSAPEQGYRYEDHAADIAGLIEALEIPSPVLLGHSMGGLAAAVVASRFPALIGGLILADPTFLSEERQREVRDSQVAEQHAKLLDLSLDEVIQDLRTRHPRRSLATIERIAAARFETRLNAFDVLRPPNPDYRQLMRSIDVPTLLVTSDGGVVSKDQVFELQAARPKLQTAEIKDAGHGLFYDQPAAFSTVVRLFLRSIESSQRGGLL